MLKLVTLALISALAFGQDPNFNGGQQNWYCDYIKNTDCMIHILEPRCGTDSVTYRNMCALAKAHCLNQVNQLHEGGCTTSHTTTLSPQEIVHGSQIILDFQCAALSHRDCVSTYNEKICGTDNRTYADFCEYEKARCTHRHLHVAKLGDCSA